jgi:hypothetical protein
MSKKLSQRARRLLDEHNRAVVLLGHVAAAMQEAKSLAGLSLTQLAAATGVDRVELHRFSTGRATLKPDDLEAVIGWIDSVEGAVADVPAPLP